MTLGRLILRNLGYHWRGNLAVFLGVVVGAAVLVGALLVGDSLRGSLRDLTLRRLGWVEHALVTGRFFREQLADDLGVAQISPVLLMQGSVRTDVPVRQEVSPAPPVRRAGMVTILGVTERFWHEGLSSANRESSRTENLWDSTKDVVALSANLARELGVQSGDTVTLHMRKASSVARESWLGRGDAGAVVGEVRLTVSEILPDDSAVGRFNLRPSPVPPRNAFVPLHTLQSKLEVPGQVNALLAGSRADDLPNALARHLTLADWGLEVSDSASRAEQMFRILDPRNRADKLRKFRWEGRVPDALAQAADSNGLLTRADFVTFYRRRHNYLSLESKQMLLEDAVVAAAEAAAKECNLRAAPTLVYLANSIARGRTELGAALAALDPSCFASLRLFAADSLRIPYSVVAALDPRMPAPLGPFLPPHLHDLPDDGILLADWPQAPFHAQADEPILLRYFEPERRGRLVESSALFSLKGLLPLAGPAYDPDLTPKFPGITDRLDLRTWDPPFPYDNRRIRPRDEEFWKQYRTTPKAYVTLARGRALWQSRYGKLTSIRLAPMDDEDPAAAAARFRASLLQHLRPEQGGFLFDAVRQRSLEAAAGGTDFGLLFLGFSFFLIASALLLVGLLFRLNLDRRAAEVGLLLALGYRPRTVRRLLLCEGGLLAGMGALVGVVGSLLYAQSLLELLNAWWPSALDRSLLKLHVTASSVGVGYGASLAVSMLTIAWATRIMGQVAPCALLHGQALTVDDGGRATARRLTTLLLLTAVTGSLACLAAGGRVSDHEWRAGTFFGGGALMLTAGLTALWKWLHGSGHQRLRGHGWKALARLGCRNAARHPLRSLLTAGLLASASFLIVAVDSFRRVPDQDFLARNSGSGGFSLLAEADLPLFVDLNSDEGRAQLNFSAKARAGLQGVTIYPLRLRGGEDASCLNLYRPRRPRLLGVPHALVERGGFHFQATLDCSEPERPNPWRLLERRRDDGPIPVFGEANTVAWMLKCSLGDASLAVADAFGAKEHLRIAGLLKDSVFQGELLMSEANFLKLYPDHDGYNYFLIDAPPGRSAEVKDLLETALADFGFTITPTAQRLQAYLAVENTYLSTFQALGGLSLFLGALGLAVVLVRGVWERRGELALLRALGFRHSALAWLILAENGFLLTLGLGIGTLSALLAVAPHLADSGGAMSLARLLGVLALVLFVGLAAGAAAVAATLRTPLLPALRRE